MTTAIAPTVPAMTTGGMTGRTRCTSCRALFPRYIDRGDGRPLRIAADSYWTRVDGRLVPPTTDPALDSGRCMMVAEFFPNCPACGAHWGIEGGKPTEDTEVKGTFTTNACDSICANATDSKCQCECGGMNHGTRS